MIKSVPVLARLFFASSMTPYVILFKIKWKTLSPLERTGSGLSGKLNSSVACILNTGDYTPIGLTVSKISS